MEATAARFGGIRVSGSDSVGRPLILRGRVLYAARILFVSYALLAAISLVWFNHSLDRSYLTEDTEGWPRHEVVVEGLRQLHLSQDFPAYNYLVTPYVLALVSFAIAATLMWRRSDQVIVYVVSLFLIGSACAVYPPFLAEVAETNPLKALCGSIVTIPFPAGLLTLLFVFPDGRFIPRWTAVPVSAGLALLTVGFLPHPGANSVGSGWIDALVLVTVLVSAVWAQVYRYRIATDPLYRRQIRVSGTAIALALTVFVAFNVALDIGNLDSPDFPPVLGVFLALTPFFTAVSILLSLALAASIVRDRLFDIEVALNRTVVLVALTVAVGALYAVVVGGAATLFHVNAGGYVAVIGAAAVAVAFQPLRVRLQRAANRLLYGQRDEPYAVVSGLARSMESAVGAETVPMAVVTAVTGTLKLPFAAIITRDGNCMAASGTPARTAFSAPIVHGGETIGTLDVAAWPGTPLATRDRRLVEDLALQAGAAIHAIALRADLLRSRQRIVTAREEERRRIRRDLHDGLGPRLASLMMRIETERDRSPATTGAVMTDLAERVDAAIHDIRRLVYGLRPPALDDLGLVGALEQAASLGSDRGPAFAVTAGRLPPLPAAVEVAVFRIAEEAMTNALRHSQARHCRIGLQADDEQLVLTIEDDGHGIRPSSGRGVGLHSMRERAEELGGSLEIIATGAGTRIIATLPLASAEGETGD